MLRLAATFVLGYHGCDEDVAESLLKGEPFKPRTNSYDWLGSGIYFWEANPLRGLAYAHRASQRPRSKIARPAVIGAVVDLGACLDLTTSNGIEMVRIAYQSLEQRFRDADKALPKNQDRLRRELDCAVIDHTHVIYEAMGASFDTVRGVFTEGKPIYAGSAFDEETHIQIAVRNASCIKGVFRVPASHLR